VLPDQQIGRAPDLLCYPPPIAYHTHTLRADRLQGHRRGPSAEGPGAQIGWGAAACLLSLRLKHVVGYLREPFAYDMTSRRHRA
jgi:hypothetical protein